MTEWARMSRAALVLEGAADGGALKHARKGWSFYDISVTVSPAHAGLDRTGDATRWWTSPALSSDSAGWAPTTGRSR